MVSRIKALAEALEGSEVGELDLTEDGLRTYLRRRMEETVVIQPSARQVTRTRGGRRPAKGQASGHGEQAAPADQGTPILAPLTGVFYGSPSPNSDPFAQVGEVVQAGQVVCIIEAMKVFNEIKSEVSGTLIKVIAQNQQLVHKGEPLLLIKV